eukprot:TRINITY_DN2800_c0_g1_i2.p1 TRINITY_DN2800_c0_g1~~TRINITY_DN2800_c0_g1_i2.p1  ORF type:complete len:1101 (-),score=329.97 TRINITY_DN2800_c0_g1_i2:2028-5330(-)
MLGKTACKESIKKKVMNCFTEVQELSVTKKHVQTLLICVSESMPYTIQSLKQVFLQVFMWKKRSKKLASIYKLLRRFFEELRKGVSSESVSTLEEIPKELAKLCCKACTSANYLVQLRSAHMLRIVLENYGKAVFDNNESLKQLVEEACLILIKGKASLKEMAIKLATAFDNAGTKKSKWTTELLRILGLCKTVEYRRAVLENIAINKHTLPFILKKTRDVKDVVRCAVFTRLQRAEVTLDQLKVEERYEVVYNGLSDRSELVRRACEDYLKCSLQALPSTTEPFIERDRRITRVTPMKEVIEVESEQGKVMRLLEPFDVAWLVSNEDYCTLLHLLTGFLLALHGKKLWVAYYKDYVKPKLELLVNAENSWYHSGRPEPMNLLLKRRALTARPSNEQIVFLRYLCEHWNANRTKYPEAIHEVEEMLPEITVMRRVVKVYREEDNVFAANELLLMLPYYNVAEPRVNQQILLAVDDVLVDISPEDTSFNLLTADDVHPATARQYSDIVGVEENEGINSQYAELVSDQLDIQRRDVIVRRRRDLVTVAIRVLAQVMSNDPGQYKNVLKMRISDLIEQVEEYKGKIGEKLERLKDEENERLEQELGRLILEQSYPLMRALKLAVGLLQTCKLDKSDKFLHEVQEKLVKEAFEKYNDNELINFLATEYLGLYSIIDQEKCREFFPFFRSLVKGIGTTQTLKGIAALKAIFDFFLAHGKRIEALLKDESAKAKKSILEELQCLLYSPNRKLRFLVYESFSRLLFCDKLPKAKVFLISLFILLGDPKESALSPAMQIIALAFNRYTRLSLNRCRKMASAIVLLNLMWTKANTDEKSVPANCLLRKFIGYKYQSVVPPLVYRLTHAYIGTDAFINLQESKENPLVELMIMLLSDLENDLEVFPYIKVCLGICLRFVDLDNILPEVLVALHITWENLMRSVEGKEKEYYSMQSIIKRKLVILSGRKVEEESDIRIDNYKNIVKSMKETSEKVIEKLSKKYQKLKRLCGRLAADYQVLHIDESKGCYRVKRESFNRTAAPTKTKERFSVMMSSVEKLERKVSALSVTLETPKRTNAISSKRKRRMVDSSEAEEAPKVSIIQEEQSPLNT